MRLYHALLIGFQAWRKFKASNKLSFSFISFDHYDQFHHISLQDDRGTATFVMRKCCAANRQVLCFYLIISDERS